MSRVRIVDERGGDDDGSNFHSQDADEFNGDFADGLTELDEGAEEEFKQKTKKKKNKTKKKREKNQREKSNNDSLIEKKEDTNGVFLRRSSFFPYEQASPWLIYISHGKHGKHHTLYSLESQKSYKKNIAALVNKSCLIYAHGWLLMQDRGSKELMLLNPVSMEQIDLPKPLQAPPNEIHNEEFKAWFITAPPTNDACVIFFSYLTNPIFMFCYAREKKWHIARHQMGHEGGLVNFVICNNIIYAQTLNKTLCTVKFDSYQLNVKSLSVSGPYIPFCEFITSSTSLGSFGRDLYRVHIFKTRITNVIVNVNIFKMDFAANRWVKVQTIGQLTLFIDRKRHSVMASCIDNIPGVEKDCVYYTGYDDFLYRYDLATRGITMESSFRGLKDPLPCPCWLQSA